ncbi:MAG: hypothetical protein KA765_02915 [Thermoflexales bacterium]|nr:hypothetical protein [Thermoflexales bacterium]
MKRFYLLHISLGLTIILLLVAACKLADALGTHTWDAQPVLISLFTATNNTRRVDYEWSKLPDLVVYADGRLLVTHTEAKQSIYETHLQPAAVCSLLQQIAADGFWNLQQENYKAVEYADLQTIWIGVNAWQRKEVSAYGLEAAPSGTPVPPELKATYMRLRDYTPPNLRPYQPDKLAITVIELDQRQSSTEWPLQKPRLADLHSREHGAGSGVVIDHQEASDVYQLFAGDFSRTYRENGKAYQLTIRPLLPFEIWETGRKWTLPPVFQTTPTSKFKCPVD